jgi:hypothetical protein
MGDDSTPISVSIAEIDDELRPASQMRAGLNMEAVDEYQEDSAQLPPVVLMRDPKTGRYWVVDGAHRITAAMRLGDTHIRAILRSEGDYHRAFAEAGKCNRTHGLRVTNADKRARIAVAVADPVMRKWSHRRIADCCGVTHHLVSEIKAQLGSDPSCKGGKAPGNGARLSSDDDPPPEKTIGRDGKARRAPAPRQPAAPAPAEEVAAAPSRDGDGDGDDEGDEYVPDFGVLALSEDGRSVLAERGMTQQVKFRVSIRRELDRETDFGPGPYITLEIGWEDRGEFIPLATLDLIEPVNRDLARRLTAAGAEAEALARRKPAARPR